MASTPLVLRVDAKSKTHFLCSAHRVNRNEYSRWVHRYGPFRRTRPRRALLRVGFEALVIRHFSFSTCVSSYVFSTTGVETQPTGKTRAALTGLLKSYAVSVAEKILNIPKRYGVKPMPWRGGCSDIALLVKKLARSFMAKTETVSEKHRLCRCSNAFAP